MHNVAIDPLDFKNFITWLKEEHGAGQILEADKAVRSLRSQHLVTHRNPHEGHIRKSRTGEGQPNNSNMTRRRTEATTNSFSKEGWIRIAVISRCWFDPLFS